MAFMAHSTDPPEIVETLANALAHHGAIVDPDKTVELAAAIVAGDPSGESRRSLLAPVRVTDQRLDEPGPIEGNVTFRSSGPGYRRSSLDTPAGGVVVRHVAVRRCVCADEPASECQREPHQF